MLAYLRRFKVLSTGDTSSSAGLGETAARSAAADSDDDDDADSADGEVRFGQRLSGVGQEMHHCDAAAPVRLRQLAVLCCQFLVRADSVLSGSSDVECVWPAIMCPCAVCRVRQTGRRPARCVGAPTLTNIFAPSTAADRKTAVMTARTRAESVR